MRYSRPMSDSQGLMAREILIRVDLSGAREMLDMLSGTGTFLAALGRRHPGPRLHLFDLPAVVVAAEARLAAKGLAGRLQVDAGSVRDDGPLRHPCRDGAVPLLMINCTLRFTSIFVVLV